MIPTDIWPCSFLRIISLAPSPIIHPVNDTRAPSVNIQVINTRACESIPLLRPEHVEKLILRVAAFCRRAIATVRGLMIRIHMRRDIDVGARGCRIVVVLAALLLLGGICCH